MHFLCFDFHTDLPRAGDVRNVRSRNVRNGRRRKRVKRAKPGTTRSEAARTVKQNDSKNDRNEEPTGLGLLCGTGFVPMTCGGDPRLAKFSLSFVMFRHVSSEFAVAGL